MSTYTRGSRRKEALILLWGTIRATSPRFLQIMGTAALLLQSTASAKTLQLGRADYLDRVEAAWTAQIIACLMGFQFEHKVASVEWVDNYPRKYEVAPADDDWYYEMCAIRAFEKHGIGLTVEQLGEQWKENACGSWGSSEQARLNLLKGIKAPACGHPRYNKLWFTIGPQFSAEVYGLLAPGMPNLAARLAREYSGVNGYGEAVDGAVFMAAAVSLGFVEHDPRVIVRKAAQIIHPESPFREMLDEAVALAESGKLTPEQIASALEDHWHIEYPASNNAVANGALVVVGLWFGEGDFLKTLNVIYRAADFTDADCNAANAAAVIGAMHGMKTLPRNLVEAFGDRIADDKLGKVELTPPVDEKISDLARRTTAIGAKFLLENDVKLKGDTFLIPQQNSITQPAELFRLGDLMQYWNRDWTLERAGFGGAGGGIGNIRGNTHLEDDVLATWPRDTVRGVVIRRVMKLSNQPSLTFEVGVDTGRAWELEVYANNKRMTKRLINGGPVQTGERKWQVVEVDLKEFAGKQTELRLYQLVLLADKIPGNAYWKNLTLK
jgi:hypothetical protein